MTTTEQGLTNSNIMARKTRVCICALDTQFVHASPVPWALKAACAVFDKENYGTAYEIDVCEFSINDLCEEIVRGIMQKQPNVVAFSCYLWNVTLIKRVASDIKRINPKTIIVLGGPEVLHSNGAIFKRLPEADVVIEGEGECSFPHVCRQISTGELGCGSRVIINQVDLACWSNEEYQLKLAELMLPQLKNKIGYIETSRGCPFGCIYCLASAGIRKVRNLDMALVKKLLKMYATCDVRQVKFVDRTFNVDAKRACDILEIILELYRENSSAKSLSMHDVSGSAKSFSVHDVSASTKSQGGCNENVMAEVLGEQGREQAQEQANSFPMSWHFEVAADLFTDEMLSLIESAPVGLFQFEIGLQSLNEDVLETVCRKTNTDKVLSNIARLMACGKSMIHTDLIAGLPGEDIASFIKGFDRLHALYPHELQLGFLKCLEGAAINQVNAQYGMVYSEHPPYEVLRTDNLTWNGICHLKRVEEGVEMLWDSGRFCNTVKHLCDNYYGGQAFKLYEDFADCLQEIQEEAGLAAGLAPSATTSVAGAVGVNKINEAVERLIEKVAGKASASKANASRANASEADEVWTVFVRDIRTFGYNGKLPAKTEQLCGDDKIPFAEAMEAAADRLVLDEKESANARKFVKLWRLPNHKILAVNTSRKNALSNCYTSVIL